MLKFEISQDVFTLNAGRWARLLYLSVVTDLVSSVRLVDATNPDVGKQTWCLDKIAYSKKNVPSWKLTYPLGGWEDDFPSPKVGHVSFLEGISYDFHDLFMSWVHTCGGSSLCMFFAYVVACVFFNKIMFCHVFHVSTILSKILGNWALLR